MKRKRKSKNKPTALAGKKNQPKKNKAKREKQALRQGILHLHRDGYGFVLAAKEGEEDVFVPAAKINDALNTDLVAELSANGGTNYTTATLTAGGTFSTGISIAAVSGVAVTAGTTPKYRISFANQASGSKETQVHGVALLY